MYTLTKLSVSIEQKQIITDLSYVFKNDTTYALMGPNGSGKSTLAHALMGNPAYTVTGTVTKDADTQNILELEAHERAAQGLFLSFQTPMALQGVRVAQLLQLGLGKSKPALTIRQELQTYAKELNVPADLLTRSLNEGASGGERKKIEVLQAAVSDKPFEIYDEIDTGVDVDAMRDIGSFLQARKKGKTRILITHYTRLLHHIQPDVVLVMSDGRLVAEGDISLAHRIETHGYAST